MSEAAPGLPDSPEFAKPGRAELASAIRKLIDAAMTAVDTDTDTLRDVARDAEQLAFRLGGGRDTGSGYVRKDHGDYLPRSPAVGDANPLAPAISWEVVDGGVEARGTFGAPYEGPPSFVHGGMIALAFDEILGITNIEGGHPGMTARLTVHYRRPTPLFRELRWHGTVDRVEGRRIMSSARLYHDDVLTAEADGIFVQPRPELAAEYFGVRDEG